MFSRLRSSKEAALNRIYRLAFGRWPRRARPAEPGYSLLLAVPPDLPVFLEIAVSVCRRQDPSHRVETLVIPDRHSSTFRSQFERISADWPEGQMRLVGPTLLGRLLRPHLKRPSMVHWLQLVAGARIARGSHALLHDADLFMQAPRFLADLYERCRDGALACAGIDRPSQDSEWVDDPRCQHIVACRDLMIDLGWMRSLSPNAMRPQRGKFPDASYWFETTLLQQAKTPPNKVGQPIASGLVHFEYVIGAFRRFERSRGPFEDQYFRLLLIRLFTDAFLQGSADTRTPSMERLQAGLTDPSGRVFYGPEARKNYPAFRGELTRLMECGALTDQQEDCIRQGITPFDTALGE